jgi:hypothetical protein
MPSRASSRQMPKSNRGEGLEFDEHTTKELADRIRERGIRRLAELQKSRPQNRR